MEDTVDNMLEFGLTGGIGSGKSTVSALLSGRGATIIDADAIVRDLQRPGELVFDLMVERWGTKIVQEDGLLNRAAVAEIVFSDDAELTALNEIVHPVVAIETQRLLDQAAEGSMVVHDIPLLVLPGGELLTSRDHTAWAGVIVVDTPEELAIERVMAARGMDRESIVARMDAQASRDDRKAVADFILDNSGTLAQLEAQVDACFSWMTGRAGENSEDSSRLQTGRDAGLEGPSGPEGSEAAHFTATGVEGPSGPEGSEAAHFTATGVEDPSGPESTSPKGSQAAEKNL